MTELPDRLLRDALRDTASAAASNVCVGADALAAWADGTMSGAERAAFEVHAAGCARCQALMAAMARSEPPPPDAASGRRALFSWLMPLAAATAAIVIVVSLSITNRRVPAPQAARSEPVPDIRLPAEETASKAAVPPPPAFAAPQASASATADPRRNRAIAPTARPQDQVKNDAGVAAQKTEPPARGAALNAAAAPPAAPPPAAAPPPSPAPAIAGARDLTAPVPPVAAAGAPVSAEQGRSFRSARADDTQVRMRAATLPLLIASPDRQSQWRIVGGTVEHTADAGATWQAQRLGADLPVVRAGAAPAARVCWLVGARGLVLLTTDAVSWRRMAFPESVDLVAIEATDASRAIVTTAAGRRFSTADGGTTWIRQ